MAIVPVLVALAMTTPALPAPSDCLWDAVGPSQRQTMLGQYRVSTAAIRAP
jgi:hypothetical protein